MCNNIRSAVGLVSLGLIKREFKQIVSMCVPLCFMLIGFFSFAPTYDAKIENLAGELIDNNEEYHVSNDVISNNKTSIVCWVETINNIHHRNGSISIDREFSVIFDAPNNGDINYSNETKKIHDLNFTTHFVSENFNITINKSVICGSGPVLTKIYSQWNNRQRIQINLSPAKYLENYKANMMPKDSQMWASTNKDTQSKLDDDTNVNERSKNHTPQVHSCMKLGKCVLFVDVQFKIYEVLVAKENTDMQNRIVIREFTENVTISNWRKKDVKHSDLKREWRRLTKLLVKKKIL